MLQEALATATRFVSAAVPEGIGSPKGTYTDIVDIIAPSSAPAGSVVSVTIRIKNTWTASVHVSAIGVWDTTERFIDWLDAWISAGATQSFSGSFIMPAGDVTIHAYSYYEDIDGYWRFDDERTKDVDLAAAWLQLATKPVTVSPIVVAWQKLATKPITVIPIVVAWLKLATTPITVSPIVEAWQKLATLPVTVTPAVEAWQKLTSQAVTLTPVEVPPTVELLQETIYPYAYVYDGPDEGSVFTFSSDPFIPADWLAAKFAAACESEVEKAGGRVMEVRVYVDRTPLLWTDWRIEVIGTPLEGTAGLSMTLGIALWAAILIACLAICAVIVLATWAIKTIVGTFTHKPISEEIKLAWSKETLIKVIYDFEIKLERSPTPPEELEEWSEEELRAYTNELAAAVAPPAEGLGLAIVAAGVLGLGALAVGAYALSRPKKAVK